MTPIINDDELLVLYKIISENGTLSREAVGDTKNLDSLIAKQFVDESKSQGIVSVNINGRWKYSTIVGHAHFGTNIPHHIRRLMQIKGIK